MSVCTRGLFVPTYYAGACLFEYALTNRFGKRLSQYITGYIDRHRQGVEIKDMLNGYTVYVMTHSYEWGKRPGWKYRMCIGASADFRYAADALQSCHVCTLFRFFVCCGLSNLIFPSSGELYSRPDPCHHGQEVQHP